MDASSRINAADRPPSDAPPEARSAILKISIRIVPFVALMFFINFLDRTAISFAEPGGMQDALGISAAQFGLASGIFFVGYILLEVPSNLALHRFGARRWLARIMVSWGIVSLLFVFVQNYPQLVGLRFVLGVAEAGFFPGAILFLSGWVPAAYRGKILALFYLAQPLTSVIGAPLAGLLLQSDGAFGLAGWRFMFLGVSMPAIIIGVACWFYLKDKPSDARWLTQQEHAWLEGALAAEEAAKRSAAIALWFWTRDATRRGLRTWHLAIPAIAGGVSIPLALYAGSAAATVAVISITAMSIFAALPNFWTLPTRFLSGVGAAAGVALINAVGNLAGFAAPYITGAVHDWTGSYQLPMIIVGFFMLLSAVLVVGLARRGSVFRTPTSTEPERAAA